VIALVLISCGKNQKAAKKRAPTKGLTKAKGPNEGVSDKSEEGIVNGGQIVVIQDIVFKTGDLTTPYTGLVIWKHKNGKRKREGTCEVGVWNGPSKWWFTDGTLAGEGIYKNGKWEGDYKEWHENGKLKVQVTFKDGKEEGKEIWKYDNDKVRSVTIYKAGKKDGKAMGYFENGVKSWEADWANDLTDGEYWEWYDNKDKKFVRRYTKGRRNGKEEHWFKSNRNSGGKQQKSWEAMWSNNNKQGLERHWYPSGIDMKAMTFDKGVMSGQAASFYENGQQASQRMFKDGKETYRRQWDQNGKMLVDGPVGQASQPRGRAHLWTQRTITDYCKGKTSAEIENLFGKADGSGTGGTWVYRSIRVLNPQTKKPVAVTVHFTFSSGKIAQTKITAQQ